MNFFLFISYTSYSFALWMIYHLTCSIMYPYLEYFIPSVCSYPSMNAMLLMIMIRHLVEFLPWLALSFLGRKGGDESGISTILSYMTTSSCGSNHQNFSNFSKTSVRVCATGATFPCVTLQIYDRD